MTPADRRANLDKQRQRWKPMTLAQSLDDATARFADRPFVITDEKTWTYRDIQTESNAIAAGLQAAGLGAREHVAVLMANFAEFITVKYAIARLGAVAVPINYLLRAHELTYVLEQSDAAALIVMDSFRGRDYLADLDEIMPGWPMLAGGTRLPRLRHVFVHAAGGSARPGMRTIADLAESGSGRPAEDTGFADPHFRSDVIYTSGTTGRPKGVMISHDMVLRTAYASAYTRAFEDGRRILFALPLYHVFGYIECLIACSFVGGAIIPRLIFTAEDTLGAAERHRASEMVCVPVMTLKLLELARSRGFDSTAFVAMFNSGGVSPPSIWNDIRTHLGAREVMTAYGMTETTASTACTLPEGADTHLLTSNGRLKDAGVAGEPELGGVLALYKAVDPQSGQDLPPGQMGELVARGPIITPGYYRNPAETAACIDADGWLHTGDLGWVSEDGFITLSGRRKETYRCGGEMVMPLEVEEVLNTHPLVAQAYAVGIPDARMGEIGCACIVPAGDRPTIESLLALCDSRLARFKVPRHIVFLTAEEVPMTATGRPQRVLLADIARRRLAVLS